MYSELKGQIEMLELQHKYELEKLKEKQKQERSKLLSQCTHKFDNGTSAFIGDGVQWDWYYKCEICGTTKS